MGVIEEMLSRPEFRGLWKSRTIHPGGYPEDGWSVTFTMDGEYCEVPYQETPERAAVYALEILKRR